MVRNGHGTKWMVRNAHATKRLATVLVYNSILYGEEI
jgi:hypothetical protein